MNFMIVTIFLTIIFNLACAQYPILNNYPVRYELSGATTFIPNSGSASVSGYTLTLGYMNHQWLAVQFVGLTNDVVVIQQNPFYTASSNESFSGHIVTAADYQVISDQLKADTNTSDDLNAIGYMKNRNFSITLKRALSSHNGEDWNAALYRYSMTQICFYTSENSFDVSNWRGSYSVCSYFEINNFYSTFRGLYLKDIKLNGYPVGVYGYIGGPYVSINAFFYHTTPLYTYNTNPAIVLELGAAANTNYQDYNVFSPTTSQSGDYFGSDILNIQKDISSGGFENSGLSAVYQNTNAGAIDSGISGTNVKIAFARNVSTYDTYDKKLLSTFTFCLYIYSRGSIATSLTDKYCDVVEMSYSYPRMTMPVKRSAASRMFIVMSAMVLLALSF